MFKAIIEHFHGPGFDGPYEHVVADRLQAISAGSFLGKWPGDDGLKGKEGPELSLASFVFTEVVQREVHAQRIDRMNLRTAKAVHASSQPSQAVIADDGRSCGDCEDGADTRDEARRGRCWRRAGNAWPRQAKEKPTGERTVAEEPHATHVFPGHPAKDQPASAPLRSSRMLRTSAPGHPANFLFARPQNKVFSR